ncbi:S1 RNA-binding domain-containing protein 1 [Halictus rubicundus]|uniref:S1 RNA-binding domain-containing protein 1 n=1 Tax=Halictus rubicundus TaxID=77578 RepID=UPI00403584FC
MKRSLRVKTEPKVIIELSDSEDEVEHVSSGDEFVPDKKKATTNRKKKMTKPASTAVSRKRKATCAQPKKTGPRSKKVKTETVSDSHVEKLSDSEENEGQSFEDIKTKIEDIDKENIKIESVDKENNEVLGTDKTNVKDSVESKLLSKFNSVECRDWTAVDYVSEVNKVDKRIAQNVINLLKEDNTIPFIARYRRNMTGGMEADKLRGMKESFDQATTIKHKAATILKAIDKSGQWTPNIHAAIISSKCLDDLEYIHSLFKTASTKSLAERAKKVGLEHISNTVLRGEPLPDFAKLVDPDKEGLKTLTQVKEGIMHIIGDVINKDKVIFDKVKEIQSQSTIKIQTTECKTSKSDTKEKDASRKYEMYYDFNTTTRAIRPHQILAIFRGEAQKILTVKIILPDYFQNAFKSCCCKQYQEAMQASKYHSDIMHNSITYAFTKFIKPLVVRRVKNELKEQAETASIEVFAVNVKQLLLTSPVRGKIVLGIDPGFYHGCKLAVISEHGNVLDTGVIYPHKKGEKYMEESASVLMKLINKHKCTLLALGNATACRETEVFLNELIKSKAVNISYAIVDEAGASIYSCSTEAKSEFPDLDTNLVSAVSIARRLQDPLAELVKVEPKHLGVGMYQHDLPQKQLSTTLNEVVSEAVSFVGVDVNTASQCLLKRVAGLNVSRANSIIQWRSEFGPFKNRKQLLEVKGIGNKTFEQCAGFIRILPETSMADASVQSKGIKKYNPNLLDQTWIHPESYEIAERFIKDCKCNLEDLGSNAFIERVTSFAKLGCAALAQKFDTDETTMEIIVKGLSMKKDEDIRLKSNCPLFKNSMLSINDISSGTLLTGAVRNVTHFGAFVDVGVGRDGLIPIKWMRNCVLTIGQRVEVKVLTVDVDRKRISLELIRAL